MWWVHVLSAAAVAAVATAADQPDQNRSDAFVPTHDWQPVQKGQAIPEGLHIRMNLEKKTVEAKILEPEEKDQKKSLSVIPEDDTNKNDSEADKLDSAFTIDNDIEEALKKIPADKLDASENKFRTLDELRIEFKDLKLSVKSDFEIMQDLFKRHNNLIKHTPDLHSLKEKPPNKIGDVPATVEMLDIFIDLEYLVHQYDNANEFVRLKGFETIIYPFLNGTENTLKAEALKVLTACLQNNIKAQIYALDTNAGEKLLRILSLDPNEYIKTRAIRALGCLIRGFPAAQKYVASNYGLDVFHNILLSENPKYFKLKLLVMTLLDDLILEHRLASDFVTEKPENAEKLRQYDEVNLLNKLSNPLFCDILSKLLQDHFEYNKNDLDNMHKIVTTMTTFVHSCKDHHFKDKKMLKTFHKMQTLFKKNIAKNKSKGGDPEDNEIYANILEFIEKYMSVLKESQFKDEL